MGLTFPMAKNSFWDTRYCWQFPTLRKNTAKNVGRESE